MEDITKEKTMTRKDFNNTYGNQNFNGEITIDVIKAWNGNPYLIQTTDPIKNVDYRELENFTLDYVRNTDRDYRLLDGERYYQFIFVVEENEVGCFVNGRCVRF